MSKMKVNQTLWLILEGLQADFKTKLDLDFRLKKKIILKTESTDKVFLCLSAYFTSSM